MRCQYIRRYYYLLPGELGRLKHVSVSQDTRPETSNVNKSREYSTASCSTNSQKSINQQSINSINRSIAQNQHFNGATPFIETVNYEYQLMFFAFTYFFYQVHVCFVVLNRNFDLMM